MKRSQSGSAAIGKTGAAAPSPAAVLGGIVALFGWSSTPAVGKPPWMEVDSWAYQLTQYKDDRLDQLVAAPVDLVVIDLTRDGESGYFERHEIEALADAGKHVLAYFEIAAIERYRPEWPDVPRRLMAGAVGEWPDEQYVRYWDEAWWPIVRDRIDRAVDAGFDGAYLDMLTTYSEIPDSGISEQERAQRMARLVIRLSRRAKERKSDFKIVPQNCPELATWSFWGGESNEAYLAAIDGQALESPYFRAHDAPCHAAWCAENRENAIAVKKRGKLLLGVDYATQPQAIAVSCRLQREGGFVPLVAEQSLNTATSINSDPK